MFTSCSEPRGLGPGGAPPGAAKAPGAPPEEQNDEVISRLLFTLLALLLLLCSCVPPPPPPLSAQGHLQLQHSYNCRRYQPVLSRSNCGLARWRLFLRGLCCQNKRLLKL